jgi:hypothetical protein
MAFLLLSSPVFLSNGQQVADNRSGKTSGRWKKVTFA